MAPEVAQPYIRSAQPRLLDNSSFRLRKHPQTICSIAFHPKSSSSSSVAAALVLGWVRKRRNKREVQQGIPLETTPYQPIY
jgi:hypothetical protein